MLRSLNLLTLVSLLFLVGKTYSAGVFLSCKDDYVVTSGYPVRYQCIAAGALNPSQTIASMWARGEGIEHNGFTMYKLAPCIERKTAKGLVSGYDAPEGMTILGGADVYAPENAFVLAVVVEKPRAGCFSRCFGPKIMSKDKQKDVRAAMFEYIRSESRKPGANIVSRA